MASATAAPPAMMALAVTSLPPRNHVRSCGRLTARPSVPAVFSSHTSSAIPWLMKSTDMKIMPGRKKSAKSKLCASPPDASLAMSSAIAGGKSHPDTPRSRSLIDPAKALTVSLA